MESGADLEQRCDTTDDANSALHGLQHSRHDPKKRALARAVPSYDPDRIAATQCKRNVAQRPEILVHDTSLDTPNGVFLERDDSLAGDAVADGYTFKPYRETLVLPGEIFRAPGWPHR